jgi:hypothetical protein
MLQTLLQSSDRGRGENLRSRSNLLFCRRTGAGRRGKEVEVLLHEGEQLSSQQSSDWSAFTGAEQTKCIIPEQVAEYQNSATRFVLKPSPPNVLSVGPVPNPPVLSPVEPPLKARGNDALRVNT